MDGAVTVHGLPDGVTYLERLAKGDSPGELILELLEDRLRLMDDYDQLLEEAEQRDDQWREMIRIRYFSLREFVIVVTIAVLVGLVIGVVVGQI
jgi:hypothetical protein